MNEAKVKLETQGFLGNKRQGHKEHIIINSAHNDYTGMKLDKLQIKATITNYDDVKGLIKFLSNISPCFFTPSKP